MSVYFQLYLDSTLAFARTLVIKCGAIADHLNTQLELLGHAINYDDLTTWKYYRNLAGLYHPTDRPMSVRSMDTLETIAFTRENLAIHRATAREYKVGSRYYKALVEQFPDQVPLINGIIAPVSISQAIAAKDGDILYHDTSLVESNETQLVYQLQVWMYGFFNRHYNSQYRITDELYLSAFLGILYLQIPQQLQLIRLRAARTPQVHSFHIREYFASNGKLDGYLPYMTKEQQLFIYRNLRFIQRNVGKQAIFDRLVKNLLTKRGLPLTWYRLRNNVEGLPEEIHPEVEMAKYPVNSGYIATGAETESVYTILSREYNEARDNPAVMFDAEQAITEQFSSSQYSQLPTKVHESEVVDRSNASVRSLENVLLNHWVYMAASGRYRAYVNIPNPRTGEAMTASVKDAYLIALYSFAKMHEIDLGNIPKVIVYEVLRSPLPNYMELESIIDYRYVPNGMIQAIMDRVTPLGEYTSTEGFYNACVNLHQEYLKLWELYSFQEHYLTRGLCEHLVKRHFMHTKCSMVDQTITFEHWLADNGYPIADFSRSEFETLFTDCVKISTGANLVTRITLGEVQRAMIGMMRQLSSYSVQYLRNINHSDFRYVGFPAIRVGDIGMESEAYYRFASSRINALSLRAKHKHDYMLSSDDLHPPVTYEGKLDTVYRYDPTVCVSVRPEIIAKVKFNVANVSVRTMDLVVDNPTPPDDILDQYQQP